MHNLGEFCTELLQQELVDIKEPEEIYSHNEFDEEYTREVNPFKQRNFLSYKCNQV